MIIRKHSFTRKSSQTVRFAGKVKSLDRDNKILLLTERENTRKISSDLKLISNLEIGDDVAVLVKKTEEGWLLLGTPEKLQARKKINHGWRQ